MSELSEEPPRAATPVNEEDDEVLSVLSSV
jgi:hypothetical protein